MKELKIRYAETDYSAVKLRVRLKIAWKVLIGGTYVTEDMSKRPNVRLEV